MSGFLDMMAAPIVMALILVAMHSHLGWHVVRRGVIFVDIALAQVAAFGVAVALLFGGEIGTDSTYLVALAATFLGAALIAATRPHEKAIPQEAYIGIIYAVASAAMILVLTQVPHGGEEINHLLVGALLWVTWPIVIKTGLLYAVLGGLLWLWRRPLRRISTDAAAARAEGLDMRRWDLAFYVILGTVVTSSVQVAGVLLVFALLVVPTVMGIRLLASGRTQFLYTLGVGVLAVVLGSGASYVFDLPTGTAIVCCFGAMLLTQVVLESLFRRRVS
jgi:zinc/manganese transport system permease protein